MYQSPLREPAETHRIHSRLVRTKPPQTPDHYRDALQGDVVIGK